MTRKDALRLRQIVEKAAVSLDDKTASEAATLFPRLKGDGSLVRAGTRINWNGTVKKAAADLWDTVENDPDHAPDLWADLAYRDGYRFIPKVISVPEAFALGECGWWEDELYRSKLESNVYTPAAYPDGWEKIRAKV